MRRGDAHRRGVCLSLLCREGGEAVPFRELGIGGLPLGLKSLAGGEGNVWIAIFLRVREGSFWRPSRLFWAVASSSRPGTMYNEGRSSSGIGSG